MSAKHPKFLKEIAAHGYEIQIFTGFFAIREKGTCYETGWTETPEQDALKRAAEMRAQSDAWALEGRRARGECL